MAFANKTKIAIVAIFVACQISTLFIQTEASCGYQPQPCSCQPSNKCAHYTDQTTTANVAALAGNANCLNSGCSGAQVGKGSQSQGCGSNSNGCECGH